MLSDKHENALLSLAKRLIDQEQARSLIAPKGSAEGYWFGGGNLCQTPAGEWLLCGRYRNAGDSRTGVGLGERGAELAIFHAKDPFGPWMKIQHFTKENLSYNDLEVVSIEGAALHPLPDGKWECFVSTEKAVPYPDSLISFQKPGTGVWSIDRMTGSTHASFQADTLENVISSTTPATLHAKDPVPFDLADGDCALIYCSHPFNWSSSNTSLAIRRGGQSGFEHVQDDMIPRGPVWDVAATRVTERLQVPRLGLFRDLRPLSLYFYDGAECLRSLDENPKAVKRPRGYSCEELGGLAVCADDDFPRLSRLSINSPAFVSPHGTGCSRYVSTYVTDQGILATWQQSQTDRSQPLVGHFLPMDSVEDCLSGRT